MCLGLYPIIRSRASFLLRFSVFTICLSTVTARCTAGSSAGRVKGKQGRRLGRYLYNIQCHLLISFPNDRICQSIYTRRPSEERWAPEYCIMPETTKKEYSYNVMFARIFIELYMGKSVSISASPSSSSSQMPPPTVAVAQIRLGASGNHSVDANIFIFP